MLVVARLFIWVVLALFLVFLLEISRSCAIGGSFFVREAEACQAFLLFANFISFLFWKTADHTAGTI
jgi:hypothetical protein